VKVRGLRIELEALEQAWKFGLAGMMVGFLMMVVMVFVKTRGGFNDVIS